MKLASICALTIVTVVAACATKYQSQGLTGGFTETQIDTNVWRVSFKGNGFTKGDRAEEMAMLRSAELTLANGFTYFAFADSRLSTETTSHTTPATAQTTGAVNFYGNTATINSRTTIDPGTTTYISRPTANNMVVMFKGRPNVNGVTYDASLICKSLGARYEVVCNEPKK